MNVKKLWTDSEFKNMGWHDSRLYSIAFPDESLKFVLNIDYIFKWEEATKKFWVAPCILTFEDTLNLKIDIDFKNSTGIDIVSIGRDNKRLSPNGKIVIWDYSIETDKGIISFESSGYQQKVISQPILSDSQTLGSHPVAFSISNSG